MKLEITAKKENKLFKRQEMEFEINHTNLPTPTRQEIRRQIAAKQGVGEDLVVVYPLKTAFGGGFSKGKAHLYDSRATLEATEPKYLIKRNEPKEKKENEASKEGAKSEAAPAAKPAEAAKSEEAKSNSGDAK